MQLNALSCFVYRYLCGKMSFGLPQYSILHLNLNSFSTVILSYLCAHCDHYDIFDPLFFHRNYSWNRQYWILPSFICIGLIFTHYLKLVHVLFYTYSIFLIAFSNVQSFIVTGIREWPMMASISWTIYQMLLEWGIT